MQGGADSIYRILQKTFFGGDGRSRLFVRYCMNGFGATTAMSKQDVINSLAGQIITAKNYTDKQGVGDNDTHPQFEEFLEYVGKFHKSIDGKGLEDKNAKNIIDTIYAKWNDLPNEVRIFFTEQMILKDNGEILSQGQYMSSSANSKNLIIKLRRVGADNTGLYVFANVIPTSPNSVDLKSIYVNSFEKYDATPIEVTNAAKQFEGLMMGRLLRHRLFSVKEVQSSTDSKSSDEDVYDFITRNIWHRNASGELYTMVNGKTVIASDKDPEYVKMMDNVGSNCYTTSAFKDDDTCNLFLSDCLLNDNSPDDVKKCLKTMENSNFYENVKKEIKDFCK